MIFAALGLVEGEAEGALAFWHAPLSFWGGYDSATGRVIDRTHPAFGESMAGRIVVMPSGRGSSSASSVLAEAIRLGTAPAAILLGAPDPIIAVGAIVARRLYGKVCPLAACDAASLSGLSEGPIVRLVVKKDRLEVIAG
jgi:predicted aconitase with swiveling domain